MARRALKVFPIEGENALRYRVQSRSDPEHPHLVDLSSFGGYGQCSCKNWQCRVWPQIRDKSVRPLEPKATCAHVRAALGWLLRATLHSLINTYAPDEREPTDEC